MVLFYLPRGAPRMLPGRVSCGGKVADPDGCGKN
jgi:hypothetical protein